MSASHGMTETTVACSRGYIAGPHQTDQLLNTREPASTWSLRLMDNTTQEVPPAHRASAWDAHGVAERVSVE